MMQKSLSVKKKKRILNDLIMKLDKPSSIGRTSASVRPRSSRTHENTEVVSFAEQVDKPADEKNLLVILLKECMLNNILCTETAFYFLYQTFLRPLT